MRLGIVGHEAKKFTKETEELARTRIRELLVGDGSVSCCVSGGCHLGGIDIWAIEDAKKLGLGHVEFLPRIRKWDGGYKERNIQIAENSDNVICICVRT